MLHNHALISSLLLEAWFIDAAYAEMMLPYVIELLEGKTKLSLNPQLLHEKPFPSLLDSDFRPVHMSGAGNPGSAELFGSAAAGTTAVIPIRGAITKYDGMCSYGVESYMQWIDQAEQSSAETIVFLIDSGGGQANCAFMLASRIRSMQKPTLAYVDSGMAGSAAYLIASAANKFYAATPVDMIGSIGAMFTLQDFKPNLENTKTWEIYSRLSTEKNAAFRRLRQNNDTSLLEDMLDENVIHFIEAVKDNRGDRLVASAGDPFKGATYTAAQALKLGLIDGIGPLNLALTELRKSPKTVQTKTISLQTTPEQTENSEMSLVADLIAFLQGRPEAKAEGITPVAAVATTTTPEAVTTTVTPEATTPAATVEPATQGLTLEQRLAALESKHSQELANLQTQNADLTAKLAAKPAAAATTVAVENETIPEPVEATGDVTSFRSETDEMVAKMKAGEQ